MARLDRLSGDTGSSPFGAHRRPSLPRSNTRGEPTDFPEDESRKVTSLQRAVLHLCDLPAELFLQVWPQRLRRLARGDGTQPRWIKEQAAVAQTVPAEQSGFFYGIHRRPPTMGSRISIATGNTCAALGIAYLLGSRCFKM